MSSRAWVTLATNDSYGLGALVLAHSLRRANTTYPAVVLITPSVSEAMRNRLSAVYAEVISVDVLDSRDAAHLALLQRPELGITFTKLHCWTLTQYQKCVFLDADTLIVQNCDELFEREELSAAPDVGWPDCFNSGVFVFVPSNETFNRLITFAQERGSFDGGDQGLLNSFFSDWARGDISKHLPFLYNVTSAAFYSYIPALKHYGQDLKIIHFIGAAKPWLQNFNWESRTVESPEHLRQFLQLWWDLFVGQVHSNLDAAMESAMGEEEVPLEPPPENPPADMHQEYHYEPTKDSESEFPWHHPQTKSEEPHITAQKLTMAEIHDPWEHYRGNIPPLSNPSTTNFAEDIRQYAWDYQTSHSTGSWQLAPPNNHNEHQYEHHHNQQYHDQHQTNYHHHHEQYHSHHEPHQTDYHHHHDQHFSQHEQHSQNHDHHHQIHEQHGNRDQHQQHWEHNASWNNQHQQTNNYDQSNQWHGNSYQSHYADSHQAAAIHSQAHNKEQPSEYRQEHDYQHEHIHERHSSHDPGISSFEHKVSSEDHLQKHNNHSFAKLNGYTQHFNPFATQPKVHVYHLHLDHRRRNRRHRRQHRLHIHTTGYMNGHSSGSESEEEFVIPRHPYDNFYLRHRPTIDPRGRKICSHEIPPTPSPSPPPEEDLPTTPSASPVPEEFDTASECEDQYSGVAGNLARVVPGSSGFQREAIDELTRRQGWEAGNIDFMGADSFDNIWAKISQTLNQPKQPSPPKEPTPPLKQPSPPKGQPQSEAAPSPAETASAAPEIPAVVPAPASEAPTAAPTPVPQSPVAPVPTPTPPAQVVAPAPEPKASEAVPQAIPPKPASAAPAVVPAPAPAAASEEAPQTPASEPTPAPEAPVPGSPAPETPIQIAPTQPERTQAEPLVSETVVKEAAPTVEESPVQPPEKTEPSVPLTPPASPKSTPEVSPVSEAQAPVLTPPVLTPPSPVAEAPKAAEPAVAPESPAAAPEDPEATPEKPQDTSSLTATSTDSPPLANTPSKEDAPALPAAKSEERRKPVGKLQLSPPAAADPLPTPDSELEDADSIAHAIITSELKAAVCSPTPPTGPKSPPLAPKDEKRLSVESPEVPTPPVSLAQIGVKPKSKPTTAAQIASSLAEKAESAKSAEATKPAEVTKPAESAKPVESEKEAVPVKPATPIEAALPAKPVEPTKAAAPARPSEPAKPAAAATPEPSKQSAPATPTTPTTPTSPFEPGTPGDAKKKPVKKLPKKEAGASGDAPAPVPPPRKKEKKPK